MWSSCSTGLPTKPSAAEPISMAWTPGVGPRVYLCPLAWSLGVVLMHALPGNDLKADSWWALWHLDKCLHVLAFGGSVMTWAIALAKQRVGQASWSLEVALLGSALIFGTVLESCQGAWMPGRFADWRDVVADGVGAGLALGAFQLIFGRRPGRIAND